MNWLWRTAYIGAIFIPMVTLKVTFWGPEARASDSNLAQPRQFQSISQLPIHNYQIKVTPEFENRLVDLFSEKRCDEIRNLIGRDDPSILRPSVLAIVAYCEPSGVNPEALFDDAEKREPSNATVFLVHARYRWQKDPEAAIPLWQSVLALARSTALRNLAKEYLAGTVDEGEEFTLSRKWGSYGAFQVGSSREQNPQQTPFSDPHSTQNPSAALNLSGSASVERATDYGSFAGSYAFTSNSYVNGHSADFIENDLDFPTTFHAGVREDLVLRPFGTYSLLSGSPYQGVVGLAIQGLTYRNDHKQSIQGSIFHDRLFQSNAFGFASVAEQGFHFRLDYNWEFYFPQWFLRFQSHFEHVLADQDVAPDPNADTGIGGSVPQATLTYSHTDVGFRGFFERNFRYFTLGFYPSAIVREDSDPSTYLSPTSGQSVSKRRNDLQFAIQPNLTIPLETGVQLFIWYEFSRTFSNLGPDDYIDRNTLNQTLGLSLRLFVSNY